MNFVCQRAYSIRTRIKTRSGAMLHRCSCRQRAYSIRTRIKTVHFFYDGVCPCVVREHIPLEQGLRPYTNLSVSPVHVVREHIPLEQGLRRTRFHSS